MLKVNNGKIQLTSKEAIDYSVHFTKNLFHNDELGHLVENKDLFMVVDSNVNKIYGSKIDSFFKSKARNTVKYILDANESNKTLETVADICESAKDNKIRRDSIFVAVGGGITMDIVGFVAFIYRRKIQYIRIPTTLVGLVDAGVGIKVGVNFKNSKNFLGGYYPPLAVFSDQTFLNTISRKEARCGLYEILKMAIIKSPETFDLLNKSEANFIPGRYNEDTYKIIRDSAYYMMNELQLNLFENNLERNVDFGHTFSPHIEVSSKYKIPHGEAVGIDMLLSSYVSLQRKVISQASFEKILSLIRNIGFSEKYLLPETQNLFNSLVEISNHRAGKLNLVIPTSIGSSIFVNDLTYQELDRSLRCTSNTNLFA